MANATENSAVASFAADTADKIRVADRTIRQSIRHVEKIDPKVRDRIRDNAEIADSGVELDALAAMEPQQQRKAVALVEAGQAVGIRDAKRIMEPKPPKVAPNFKGEAERSHQWRESFIKVMNAVPSQADREWARKQLDDVVADNGTRWR